MMKSSTFLFAWNPDKWKWTDLIDRVHEFEVTGYTTVVWSCQSHRQIKAGDNAYIVKVGKHGRGIFASGKVLSTPQLLPHWEDENKLVYRSYLKLDCFFNPRKDTYLKLDTIPLNIRNEQNFTPQSSGIRIKDTIVDDINAIWFDFVAQNIEQSLGIDNDVQQREAFLEGKTFEVTLTRYERDPQARQECLNFYGVTCSVCEMNFEKRFGKIGKGFIHVHHLNPLGFKNRERITDPIKDLRPVCPNCHAMLHKKIPPFSIEELQTLINI